MSASILPALPRFKVRSDRESSPLVQGRRDEYTVAEINALVASKKLNVLKAEYLNKGYDWLPLINIVPKPKTFFEQTEAHVVYLVKFGSSIIVVLICLGGCIWLIVALANGVYRASSTNSAIISILPSAVRSQDSDDGYKTGYADGMPYGMENKEAPPLIEFNALVEHRTYNRPSKFDKEQWSAGYRAGFEDGFHEAKKKAF